MSSTPSPGSPSKAGAAARLRCSAWCVGARPSRCKLPRSGRRLSRPSFAPPASMIATRCVIPADACRPRPSRRSQPRCELCATRPPDPALAGDGWRDMWLARLRSASPMSQAWLGHPHRDASWLSQSIAPDYSRIGCPVLLAAGWADPAFADGMLRTLARLEVPRLGIFGPWGHRYPHLGACPGRGRLPAACAQMARSLPQRPGAWIAERAGVAQLDAAGIHDRT